MNTEEKVVETVEENPTAEVKGEKTYTQKEYEDATKKIGGKYLSKIRKLEEEIEKNKNAEKTLKFVAESMDFKGTDDELVRFIAEHYGKDPDKEIEKLKKGDISNVEIEMFRFLNNDETTDEEIVEKFESIMEKDKLSATDKKKLDVLSKRYYEIVSKKNIRNAEKWYKENVDDDFDGLMNNQEFREFVKDLNIPVDAAVKKYCTIKGLSGKGVKKGEGKKVETKAIVGSAADKSGGEIPEYFTKEQVAKMSREEIIANFDAIEKSKKNWIKKG